MRKLAIASILLPVAALSAQIEADQVVVATRLVGTPATQLIGIDLNTGTQTPLGRFPSDELPPLAVRIDFVNDHIVLALARPNGGSRVIRLGLRGLTIRYERVLADVPQRIEELSVGTTAPNDAIYYAVSGSAGGLFSVPRVGGEPSLIARLPWASAIAYVYSATPVAVSSDPRTGTDPSVASVALRTGAVQALPAFSGFGPRTITSFHQSPAGSYFSHTDGTVSHALARMPGPVVQPITPLRPAGGAVAVRFTANPAFPGLALGGAADPTLKSFDPNLTTPQTWGFIGARLPGDPVDLDVGIGDLTTFFFYGSPCGTTVPGKNLFMGGNGKLPRIGTAGFGLTVQQGLPNSPVVFCAGVSDQVFGEQWLPLRLPSGCGLGVAPDLVVLLQTNGLGRAQAALPIPNDPALVGSHFHAQWLQQTTSPFVTSGLVSVQIGT